jgi:ketosteroid isomerase-like protein
MSEESMAPDPLELLLASRDLTTRRGIEATVRLYAPDAVIDASRTLGLIFRGREAIRGHYEDWMGACEEWEMVIDEPLDLGNGVLFAVLVQKAKPLGTTGSVQRRESCVWVWVDGMATSQTFYPEAETDEARAAAEGLAEERG